MKRALQITFKDLRLLARDRRAAMVLLALPMIFITIIGMSTGQILNMKEGGDEVSIAVVDLTGSAAQDAAPAEADSASPAATSDSDPTADNGEETESAGDRRRKNAVHDLKRQVEAGGTGRQLAGAEAQDVR